MIVGCSVCQRDPVEARGLCHACYQRWRNGAPYDAPLIRTPKGKYSECTLEDCNGSHYGKGLCRRHYLRQLAGIPLEGRDIRGEAHGKSKLTENAVRQIRMLHNQGWNNVRLGQKFAVSGDAIGDVVRGRTWKHI
jgi:hypothetical protein